jgi:hypothetical protein
MSEIIPLGSIALWFYIRAEGDFITLIMEPVESLLFEGVFRDHSSNPC